MDVRPRGRCGDDTFAVTAPTTKVAPGGGQHHLPTIDVPGPTTGGGAQPTGVAFDASDGSFVVLDTANSRVIRLDR